MVLGKKLNLLVCIFSTVLLSFSTTFSFENQTNKTSSTALATDIPGEYCALVHTLGKLVLSAESVENFGGLTGFAGADCFTGENVPYFRSEYPKGSRIGMSHPISTWYGGIVGSDTLVTQGNYYELSPSDGYYIKSNININGFYAEDAVSELDINVQGQDTSRVQNDHYRYNWYDIRPHKPLGIETSRTSYSWSYDYTDDFVLFDLEIKNINSKPIEDFIFTMTTYDGSGYSSLLDVDSKGDLIGLLQDYTYDGNCPVTEKLNMMWFADGDGDPFEGRFLENLTTVNDENFRSATDIAGVFHLTDYSNFSEDVRTSYNWWASAGIENKMIMPIARASAKQSYPTTTAHPFQDVNYYLLSANGEIDYDQTYTASITPFDPIWNYPPQTHAADISDGFSSTPLGWKHTHHLVSVGPFDIPPGGILKIPLAYVAGEDFHVLPSNGDNLPNNPDAYYSNVDFSNIAENAKWARWIYDNPGVDTDGDGDSGLYKVCVLDSQLVDDAWVVSSADTFWYQGDGVPDWRAAGPPPAPYFWLSSTERGIKVRLNGSKSETEKDLFTQLVDFEGYNIYFGRDEREASLSIVASYDYENFDKFVYQKKVNTYIVEDLPLTLETIRCAYANDCYDESFDPLQFTRSHPMFIGDSLIFFRKHSYNVSDNTIKKVFPNARDPRLVHIDSLVDDDYTDDGFYKFFEYEFEIKNLLPTVSYWINVTAFDFGSPKSGLPALESSNTLNIQEAYPLVDADESADTRKQVYVYPNPYRIDAEYRKSGFEGRAEDDRPDYRVRALNFSNLPPQCEIKIFSIDGDLIRHLSHDYTFSDPTHRHHKWDLISRNTQMIVSGLYYWTVEFPDGEVQVGKFVVIM